MKIKIVDIASIREKFSRVKVNRPAIFYPYLTRQRESGGSSRVVAGRVGSCRVGSSQDVFKISQVGVGVGQDIDNKPRVGSGPDPTRSDPIRPVRFDLTRQQPHKK